MGLAILAAVAPALALGVGAARATSRYTPVPDSPVPESPEAEIQAARDEWEGFRVVLRHEGDFASVDLGDEEWCRSEVAWAYQHMGDACVED